ncbi:hypothetical protein RND81_06G106800 [Saponaria officinalis]|uniref:Uncharacterized protein n=1 Tax=Saponaria officinalis TaxID=3572 RepID=A0AAW1K931_SAPOF
MIIKYYQLLLLYEMLWWISSKARLSFLRQKAKCDWIGGADMNTAFFHGRIKARRTINRIVRIKDSAGITHCRQEGIENAFVQFYTELLGSSSSTVPVYRGVVPSGPLVTEEHV